MTIKEELEKAGFHTFEHANEKFNELKEQFIEMAQLKSDFDIEKFTVKKEGNFLAHNFHFLMRQYSLTLQEARRLLIKKEELERKIEEYNEKLNNGEEKVIIYTRDSKQEKYTDLYIKELINQLDGTEIKIVNKAMSLRMFEIMRKKLIELNGGVPTNEQYQAEEPEYWKWFLQKKAIAQMSERKTGIHEGVWENVHYLEEKPILNPKFQVDMREDGRLNLEKAIENILERKQLNKPSNKMLEDE